MTDVPLPEPSGVIFYEGDQYEEGWESSVPAYDEAQLLAYADACVKAERERIDADARRLDFIEKRARCDPKMDGNHVWWPTTFNHRLTGPTLRAAIDQAMDGK